MLIDEIDIFVKAGHGGQGSVSFVGRAGGPDGGDGGRGGDVWVEATSDLYALNKFVSHPKQQAENGKPGEQRKKSGLNGTDLTLIMPIGTFITDEEGQEIEVSELGKRVLIAKGGLGGKGNFFFRSSRRTTPKFAQPGLEGEEKKLNLKLKLIADFGLIGLSFFFKQKTAYEMIW